MSEVFVGFVEKINSKQGQSARGPWTAYSLKLQNKEGDVDPRWFQAGFTAPACEEGDYVKVTYTPKDAQAATVNEIKVGKNAPAKPASPARSGGGGAPARAAAKTSELFGEIGGYNTEDDIRRMSFTAARTSAVAAVTALLSHDALPMSKADSKAGQAKRYEEVTAFIDKLTVQYFYDNATGRLLESVADAGNVELGGDGDLPDGDLEASGDEFEEGGSDADFD